ncbi:hypothetical protein E5P55_01190 [Candidatus Pinguicoccus supinus]|uniref:Uncharacterized protein n=1 Tax=Candidatus Pinguicoccus supinus TaxID=2529394 RepID=A0A7T0BSM0_9BACT|nr:hypothetical protein E5P55_01190 [Candidatus Pinguicoccus supinus]
MLRRLKCNVMKYLPLKREFIIKFKSINFQRYFYNKTTLNFSVLNKNCSSSTVLNKIMILRKACLDPILFFFNYKQKNITKTLKFLFILFIMRLSIFLKKKVIIFSQFASFLNIISSYLDKTFLTYLLLSGFTKNKTKVCMEFNYGTMVNILLMSSKSGSLGFNINEADIVVHYDP